MSLSTRISTWRKVPYLLVGYDIRRYEQPGGKDYYIPIRQGLQFGPKVQTLGGIPVGPTHLQYESPFGFLLTWPLCLHVWFQFHGKRTMVDTNGITETIPGSEKVFYWRFGARWEAEQDVYVVPSWYGPGLHWD